MERYEDRNIDRQEKKIPAKPISEKHLKRFKYRLEEKSMEFSSRNVTLFELGVSTGYRAQDIVRLTIGEIEEALDLGYFEIQEQKQYKSYLTYIKKHPNSRKKPPKKRKVGIGDSLEETLSNFIKGKRKSQYAFKSKKGKHISSKSFSKILKEVGEDLGLKNISGHSMRKTFARKLYDRYGDIERVRQRLGHKSIETTKVYLGLYDEDIKEDASVFDDIF